MPQPQEMTEQEIEEMIARRVALMDKIGAACSGEEHLDILEVLQTMAASVIVECSVDQQATVRQFSFKLGQSVGRITEVRVAKAVAEAESATKN